MAHSEDNDYEYRIKEGDHVVLKRGDVYKAVQIQRKKYENTVTVLKPTCRIIAMMYHGREPGKICHLRYDTLAQMLTLANVHAGSKVLVFETCAGLVLGAIMERMGGRFSLTSCVHY
ncbi:tRNA (adenine(58)-N(1))-methyltransferase non-catalytic subunit TRM6 [Goodea atripinnis]|uniref:tRNA (adenine(58)-N(1))-methyltransferase non-catalytic subunit TRM6 n=1 Tax=Goodea atripinnis TaxID=208336 RepID=A0ABV0P5B0_9TELE